MNFPNISFFFRLNSYYKKIRFIYLYNYYYKLHNILFTNLYIRIYRYKLIQLEKKKNKFIFEHKKNKFKGRKITSLNIRTYFSSSILFSNNNIKKEWSYNKQKTKKKKRYIYINKFKDCGNQYNFDPFHPSSTHYLSNYNFYRTKKKDKVVKKEIVTLSSFDTRLNNVNFKYFNNYLFSLILDIYKNQKTKNSFLLFLKKNSFFCYNFLLFLKKRIVQLRIIIQDIKKTLTTLLSKLNIFLQMLQLNDDDSLLLIKKKFNLFLFDTFYILIEQKINKYNHFFNCLDLYKSVYFSLFDLLKKQYILLKKKQQERLQLQAHFRDVNRHELLLSNLVGKYARTLSNFNIKNINRWEKKNLKNSIYINLFQYITIYRSMFKYKLLNNLYSNGAILYIKSTISNVYLYFIYKNKVLLKKTCGELVDIKKKERRFWRNIYPLVESLLPALVEAKQKYKFPFISLYMNGSSSLCTPLLSRMRKYNKRFRRLIYFLSNELSFFQDKTSELKERFKCNYVFFPIYRLKLFSIFDGFNRLSKIFFAINKVRDMTSWPYNGCKKKKKYTSNVR